MRTITSSFCLLIFQFLLAACASQAAPARRDAREIAAWAHQAQNVTIIRDTWGIPHVFGKSDADAVFGVIYAQAEDDFNRVETNYLNAMGRLAEAEGESAVYRDLRMKLFIDPSDLKAKYDASPSWLKSLMNAYADGLNYYVRTHPSVTPRAIKRFEPWMALSFTEGSIGGDIERINLTDLQAFYASEPRTQASIVGRQTIENSEPNDPVTYVEPTGSNGIAVAPSNTAPHHALLLINPHTS